MDYDNRPQAGGFATEYWRAKACDPRFRNRALAELARLDGQGDSKPAEPSPAARSRVGDHVAQVVDGLRDQVASRPAAVLVVEQPTAPRQQPPRRPPKSRPPDRRDPEAMQLALSMSLKELEARRDTLSPLSTAAAFDRHEEAIEIKQRQIAHQQRHDRQQQRLSPPAETDCDTQLKEFFAMVPRRMRRRRKAGILSFAAVEVYSELADHYAMRGTNEAWPSQATLSRETGLSVPTVKRALAQLKADHWIVVHRTGRSNRYQALPWPEVRRRQAAGSSSARTPRPDTKSADLQPSGVSRDPSDRSPVIPKEREREGLSIPPYGRNGDHAAQARRGSPLGDVEEQHSEVLEIDRVGHSRPDAPAGLSQRDPQLRSAGPVWTPLARRKTLKEEPGEIGADF